MCAHMGEADFLMKRLLFLCVLLLSACSEAYTTFPIREQQQADLPSDVNVVLVSSKNISQFHQPYRAYQRTNLPKNNEWSYMIGIGDVISVTVFDHPELTLPPSTLNQTHASGFRVQADGTIYFPFVGDIEASGRSVQSVRSEVSQKLQSYINDPQVDVRIVEFNSQNIVVSGEVDAPNRQALTTVPLTLLQAINAAGGWGERADTSRIVLRRDGRSFRVDLRGFLEANYAENNPILRSGDVVHVPEIENQEAFLMGEVLKNQAVDVSQETVSLTEAVNEGGGPRQVRADARGVFVFRQNGTIMNVYQFDTTTPKGWLLGTKFTLVPQDVVFVTRSPLQHWNDTISQLLPTVSAISSLESLQRNF